MRPTRLVFEKYKHVEALRHDDLKPEMEWALELEKRIDELTKNPWSWRTVNKQILHILFKRLHLSWRPELDEDLIAEEIMDVIRFTRELQEPFDRYDGAPFIASYCMTDVMRFVKHFRAFYDNFYGLMGDFMEAWCK